MSILVSPKIAALIGKLRQAEHEGQYFSGEDVAGLIRELRAIGDGVKSLEDRIAGERRPAAVPPRRPDRAPVPIGTFFFMPAEAGRH